jgi:hypothetical protein
MIYEAHRKFKFRFIHISAREKYTYTIVQYTEFEKCI